MSRSKVRMLAGLDRIPLTHKRQVYYRPRQMGGDAYQPLCMATITGFSGDKVSTFPMTDADARVDCPNCLRHLAGGGIRHRHDELRAYLFRTRPQDARVAA